MANGFPDKLERGRQETYHTMVPNLIFFSVCVKHLNRCKTCTLIYLSCRGVVRIFGATTQRRHSKFSVICNLDADCTYLSSL